MATVGIAQGDSLLPLLKEGRPDARGWMVRRGALAGVLGIVLLLPLMMSDLWVGRISFGFVFVIVGLSINILIGYAGQVSLGHHAFVGVGAFTSALLVSEVGMSFWIAILFSAALGGVAAALLGLVALRLKGLFLALITLGYGQLATNTIFAIPDLTGGGAGVDATRPAGFTSEKAYAYLVLLVLALVWYLDWRLTRSKAGRAIFTIRENEIAAASYGINVTMYKLLAFVVSGAFAGLAGTLFAFHTQRVVSTDFSFSLGLIFVLMAVVGGLGSRPGVAIGSMFFAIFKISFPDLYSAIFGGDVPPALLHAPDAIGALLLMFTLALYPGGIGEQLRPITRWFEGHPFSMKREHGGIQAGGAGVRP